MISRIANRPSARAASRPVAAASVTEATPVTSSENTSGTMVMRRAFSHRPPTASTASAPLRRPGSPTAPTAAPATRPAARASRTRTLSDRSMEVPRFVAILGPGRANRQSSAGRNPSSAGAGLQRPFAETLRPVEASHRSARVVRFHLMSRRMPDVPVLPCPPLDAGVLPGRTVDLERLDVAKHAPGLWKAIGHDDALWTWIPSGPFAEEADFTAWLVDRGQRPTQSLYAVIDKTGLEHTPAGLYMALSINPDQGVTEVGLNLGPSLSRKVGGTEAFFLLVDDIFSKGYRRVEWRCTPENEASSRAAARLGFTLEGTLRQTYWLKGGNWDTEVHAFLDGDWPAIRERQAGWLSAGNFDAEGMQIRPMSDF